MNSHRFVTARAALAGAVVAAALLAAQAVIQLTHEQSSVSTTEGAIEHLALALFTATCLALALPILRLGAVAGRALPARLSATGSIALGLLAVVSNVRGEDPAFFGAVAVPANLLAFGGIVTLAVVLRRQGRASLAVAVALGLAWPLSIVAAQAGGGLLAAACWLVVARTLLASGSPAGADAPRRSPQPVAQSSLG